MKKTFSLLFVLSLAFMTNATKNDLPKNVNSHIIKGTKAQVSKVGRILAKKSLSLAGKKTIKSGFFFDYCLTYEWMWCDNHLSQITHCSTSWQEVYNWMSSAYCLSPLITGQIFQKSLDDFYFLRFEFLKAFAIKMN